MKITSWLFAGATAILAFAAVIAAFAVSVAEPQRRG